jgi:hypothetical protein
MLFNNGVSTAAHISNELGEKKTMQSKIIMKKELAMFCWKTPFWNLSLRSERETIKKFNENEGWVSHCRVDVDVGFLGCDAVSVFIPRRKLLSNCCSPEDEATVFLRNVGIWCQVIWSLRFNLCHTPPPPSPVPFMQLNSENKNKNSAFIILGALYTKTMIIWHWLCIHCHCCTLYRKYVQKEKILEFRILFRKESSSLFVLYSFILSFLCFLFSHPFTLLCPKCYLPWSSIT